MSVIKSHDWLYVGGLAGEIQNSIINNVTANITISAQSTQVMYVGGIVGFMTGGNITNCSANGTINAKAEEVENGEIYGYWSK